MSRIRELLTQLERRDIDPETERLMRNWSRWKSGVPIGLAVSSAYELEARGRREEVSIPLLNGEAMEVDRAVEALPGELKDVIRRHWLQAGGTIRQRAKACRCAVATYYRRLHQAHQRIRATIHLRRERGRRIAGARANREPFTKPPL